MNLSCEAIKVLIDAYVHWRHSMWYVAKFERSPRTGLCPGICIQSGDERRNKVTNMLRIKYCVVHQNISEANMKHEVSEHAHTNVWQLVTICMVHLGIVCMSFPWSYDHHVWCWHTFTTNTLQGLQCRFTLACYFVCLVAIALISLGSEILTHEMAWQIGETWPGDSKGMTFWFYMHLI